MSKKNIKKKYIVQKINPIAKKLKSNIFRSRVKPSAKIYNRKKAK